MLTAVEIERSCFKKITVRSDTEEKEWNKGKISYVFWEVEAWLTG